MVGKRKEVTSGWPDSGWTIPSVNNPNPTCAFCSAKDRYGSCNPVKLNGSKPVHCPRNVSANQQEAVGILKTQLRNNKP